MLLLLLIYVISNCSIIAVCKTDKHLNFYGQKLLKNTGGGPSRSRTQSIFMVLGNNIHQPTQAKLLAVSVYFDL